MEKAFAYICADAEATPRLLRRYCRKVYELGYVPICPKLSEAQYLQPDDAEIGAAEKKNIICTTLDGLAKIKEANENGRL